MDGSIRQIPGASQRIRTNLSCTPIFAGPDEYDGGELIIEGTYGSKSVKLPAGHMVIYPATSLHRVTPATRGTRPCSFFCVPSMVRSDEQWSILLNLNIAIQRISAALPKHDAATQSAVQLTGVYLNLIRQWAEM